jgi:NADH-quinone oxidoreductase subunit J
MVLFLFVIMLLGAERIRGGQTAWQWGYPLTLGILLFGSVVYFLMTGALTGTISSPDAAANAGDTLKTMSMMLFNQYLLPFEVTSILLLTAMVGAIVLTKQEKGERG